jgi:hypothetical protein
MVKLKNQAQPSKFVTNDNFTLGPPTVSGEAAATEPKILSVPSKFAGMAAKKPAETTWQSRVQKKAQVFGDHPTGK